MLRESIRLAQLVKSLVEADPDFEVAAPVPLSLVCFRHKGGNEFNRQLLDGVNASGKAFLSHTVLDGKFTLRFAIGNFQTSESDIRETLGLHQRPALPELRPKRLNAIRLLETELCGIRLRNPVLAASGTFGYGLEFAPILDLNQLGGIVTKGLSPEANRR